MTEPAYFGLARLRDFAHLPNSTQLADAVIQQHLDSAIRETKRILTAEVYDEIAAIPVGVSATGQIAVNDLSGTGNVFTVDDQEFTFIDVLSIPPVDGETLLDADDAVQAEYIAAAINTLSETVLAVQDRNCCNLTVKLPGVAGNSIVLTEDARGLSITPFAGGEDADPISDDLPDLEEAVFCLTMTKLLPVSNSMTSEGIGDYSDSGIGRRWLTPAEVKAQVESFSARFSSIISLLKTDDPDTEEDNPTPVNFHYAEL